MLENLLEKWKFQAPPDCMALLFQELVDAVSKGIQPVLLSKLRDAVEDLFSSTFLLDLDWKSYKNGLSDNDATLHIVSVGPFFAELWGNLDNKEASICIRLGSLLTSMRSDEKAAATWLSPALRLLARLYLCIDSNLDAIDGVLGCPLQMFPSAWLAEVKSLASTQQELIVECLFHAITWLRELVAAFAPHASTLLSR